MANLDLSKYGINDVKEIYHNLSYEELFKHVTNPELEGFERGYLTDTGAVTVDTGIYTGRSPKDKYIVRESENEGNIWWRNEHRPASDNKPISEDTWTELLAISAKQLSGKKLYIQDGYAGANENTRIKVRIITEVAWMAHFVKNMFVRPTDEEAENFEPDYVMLNAAKAKNPNWKQHGMHSDVYAAFNLKEKMACVGGTWYGGEIKKGFFSVMNYLLPLKGIAAMHCSANVGKDGDTAIFFGLSGTGKTTLSADPNRALIGDDEHGWDDDGVFNFEGGCYAKTIDLDAVSKAGHAKKVIFLTADAFGVLPPVSKLTPDQTKYHFISGYTAKVAGTERGIKEPVPSFSACFGAAFLLLDPVKYADELIRKMDLHGATAYLVNTGWIGGAYGTGKRIDLPATRKIIDAILDGSLDNAEFENCPIFNLAIPKAVNGVDSKLLNPRNLWEKSEEWDNAANKLGHLFVENFKYFTDNPEAEKLVETAGPKL